MSRIAFLAIAFLALTTIACDDGGSSGSDEPAPPPPSTEAWAKLAPIIEKDCGSCHDGVKEPPFKNGADFKASPAKAKLQAGLMPPPPRVVPPEDKAAMLSYLGG